MGWLHLASSKAALVSGTANEQWLPLGRFASWDSLWWNLVSTRWHPLWVAAAQHFVVAVWMLSSAIRNIGHFVRWNQFAWNKIAAVTGTGHIQWLAIVATLDGTWWNLPIGRWNPAWGATAISTESTAAVKERAWCAWWNICAWWSSAPALWLIYARRTR